MAKQLFRNAAVDRCQTRWLGDIVLLRPLSFSLLTAAAVGVALLLVIFFASAEYTKRSTVSGRLVPDTGVLKVFPAQQGVVLQKRVTEGEEVKKGAVLFVISSERQIGSEGPIQATVSRQVALRQQSLRDEITHTRQLQEDSSAALHKKIVGLEAEKLNIAHQISGQKIRVELADENLKRAHQLLLKGYISAEMAQQKQADLLDQENRLQALERDRISTDRELEAQRSELTSLPLRQHNDISQLERLLSTTAQEWTESEGKRRVEVVAPEDGIATAVIAETGQTVEINQPLATIIPKGATLQAHLYAPSRAIGFVRTGDEVLLRYQAYPYQKFGHAVGKVLSVSRTVLTENEWPGQPSTNNEPVYQIRVALKSQTIPAYGKPEPLQPGMLVDADVLHEKRKIYEWILEPMFSVSGKLR